MDKKERKLLNDIEMDKAIMFIEKGCSLRTIERKCPNVYRRYKHAFRLIWDAHNRNKELGKLIIRNYSKEKALRKGYVIVTYKKGRLENYLGDNKIWIEGDDPSELLNNVKKRNYPRVEIKIGRVIGEICWRTTRVAGDFVSQ